MCYNTKNKLSILLIFKEKEIILCTGGVDLAAKDIADENSVKNHTDMLIFHTSICDVSSQICLDATKKSPLRISSSVPTRIRFGI